jgi:O-acetyl-ADP-ribose deacetylase (regulator of RNase III)
VEPTVFRFVTGNIFEANVDALVNTVNTVGVMGKGIALQFSRAYPEIVRPYEHACQTGELDIGKVFTVKLSMLEGPRYIINFPTKKHWKGDSRIEYIESGLESLIGEIRRLNIRSIAVPPLGCGLGGLPWSSVKRLIESKLSNLPAVDVAVYEPKGAPRAAEMRTATKKPRMTSGRAALLGLIKRYLVPLMDYKVTLLEVHKLMYFMREGGEVPKLKFVKGKYGPYSENLRHVLSDIEGHYLTGFGDADEKPGVSLEPLPGAIEKAEEFLASQADTLLCFRRVVSLIDGFETAFGMELLASVHWVAKHEDSSVKTLNDAIRLVHDWNGRKAALFSEAHISTAWGRLEKAGWL